MIKYFCLLAIGVLTFCTSRAQVVKKGEKLVGAYLQFGNENDKSTVPPDYYKLNTTNVNPSFGVAIKDNLELGGRLSYEFAHQDQANTVQPQSYTRKSNGYGLAVYLRRYKELGHGFAAYIEGDVTGGYFRDKASYGGTSGLYTDQKSWSAGVAVSGGITYRATHHWMLQAGYLELVGIGFGGARDKGQDVDMGVSPGKSSYFGVNSNARSMLKNFAFGCIYILD